METNHIKKRLDRIKVIYTDVDNTLVIEGCLFKSRHGYSIKNAQAIYDLLTAGVDVVMVSGRKKERLLETARLLGFRNYIGNMGMKIIYNRGEKVIKNYGREINSPGELKNWIQSTGVAEALLERFKGRVRFYTPWSEILQTHLLFIGELDFAEVDAWIHKNFPELRFVDNGYVPPEEDFSSPHAYHILPKGVGKQAAVAIDKRERRLKKEELIAIGDSMEDMTIADEVGVYFSLDHSDTSNRENVLHIKNDDGQGFSRIVRLLKELELI